MKTVKQIRWEFARVQVPERFKKSVQMELNTLEAQERRHGGILPNNSQVYASLGNLRKIYKLCNDGGSD